jgi:hypothetical protein
VVIQSKRKDLETPVFYRQYWGIAVGLQRSLCSRSYVTASGATVITHGAATELEHDHTKYYKSFPAVLLTNCHSLSPDSCVSMSVCLSFDTE